MQNNIGTATLLRRIGSTVYTVRVHFSNTSNETLEDKILRLTRNDGLESQSTDARKALCTGQSQERRAS